MIRYEVPFGKDLVLSLQGTYTTGGYYCLKIKLDIKSTGLIYEKYRIDNPDFDTIKRKGMLIVNDMLHSSYNKSATSSDIVLKVFDDLMDKMQECKSDWDTKDKVMVAASTSKRSSITAKATN